MKNFNPKILINKNINERERLKFNSKDSDYVAL